MRRFFDALFTAVALIFFIPTLLVLISWNAIPGDSLYPLKKGLEDITLLILSGTPLVPKASMKFTERRFSEASVLLSKKSSTAGYSLLVTQAKQTQNYITAKNDKTDSTVFIQDINKYQAQIEQKKQQVIAEARASGVAVPISTSVPIQTQAPVATPAPETVTNISPTPPPTAQLQQITTTSQQAVVIEQETPQEVVTHLDEASGELEVIKANMRSHNFGNGEGSDQDHGRGQPHP